MNTTCVILNPTARSERARGWQERVRSICTDAVLCATSHPGEAEKLARNAVREGFERIVAAGGDGTINEVVNGIAGSDATRLIDLPSANGKHFVQLAGVGLDAQVVKETSLALKRNFGPLSYLFSAAQIAGRQPPRLLIESENAVTDEGSFILIGNGRRYGGPFPFFKHAMIDDGLLDVLVFKRLGYLEIIKYLQNVIFTSDITLPEVEYFQTRRLRVSSEEEVPVEIDGELVGICPVEFELSEQRLKVLAPA